MSGALSALLLAGGGIVGPPLSFKGLFSQTTGGGFTSGGATYTAVPIGPAAANRTVMLFATIREASGNTIDTVTIGGVSAVNMGHTFNSNVGVTLIYLWVATVPTGTTADIIVTYSGAIDRADGLSVYVTYGLNSNTPTATASSILTNGPALSLPVSLGGFIIAAAYTFHCPSVAVSWSGVVADGEILTDPSPSTLPQILSSASTSLCPAASPRTVSGTYNGTSTDEPVALSAAFR